MWLAALQTPKLLSLLSVPQKSYHVHVHAHMTPAFAGSTDLPDAHSLLLSSENSDFGWGSTVFKENISYSGSLVDSDVQATQSSPIKCQQKSA